MKYAVCHVDEIMKNEVKPIEVNGRSIVLVRTENDEYYAVRNKCSHQGVELHKGSLLDAALVSKVGEYCFDKDNKVLRCPWHNYEFCIKSGKSPIPGDRHRVKTYEVSIAGEEIYIEVK